MPEKIVFLGSYGGLDTGDEAQLSTPLIELKKSIPGAEFLALSPNPEHTAKFHKVESDWTIEHYLTGQTPTQTEIEPPHSRANPDAAPLRKSAPTFIARFKRVFRLLWIFLKALHLLAGAWILHKTDHTLFLGPEARRFLDHLRTADLLFNVGGGTMPGRPWVSSLGRLGTFLICKMFGKPVIVSGQTIGPFERSISKRVAAFFLNKVDMITLRDTTSLRDLQDIGINKPVLRETADDSILLPVARRDEIETALAREKIGKQLPLIGINALASLETIVQAKRSDQIRLLANTADRLISQLRVRVVFIPMDYGATSDDRVIELEILASMEHNNEASVITNGYDDRTLKGIIGEMDMCIGFRYHFVVFATTMRIPTVGLYLGEYYKRKITGILQLMGQDKYAIDFAQASPEQLVKVVEHTLLNKDSIAKQLEKGTNILGERSLFTIRYATKLLGE